jgi:hypothetical protein
MNQNLNEQHNEATQIPPKAEGVTFDNIPPSTSNQASVLSCGGEDTARISFWVSFDGKEFSALGRKLDEAKMDSQDRTAENFIIIAGEPWTVSKSGFHLGGAAKSGPYYRWQLRNGGIRIGLMNRSSALKCQGAPNLWVEIGSEMLMVSCGLKNSLPRIFTAIHGLGAKINADALSEVHVCVDMPEADVGEFVQKFNANHWVSRAKRRAMHSAADDRASQSQTYGFGLHATGFEFGSGINLCVYEKRFEVRNSMTKLPIMEKLRWNGQVAKAVRVEFKARREKLKERGINTLADWEEKKAGFCAWLTQDWFRMTEGEVDRTHTTQAETWFLWKMVQAMFEDWCGKAPSLPKARLNINANVKQLVKQAAGCMTQAFVLSGVTSYNLEAFAENVRIFFRGYLDFEAVKTQLTKKTREFAARVPHKSFLRRDSEDSLECPS